MAFTTADFQNLSTDQLKSFTIAQLKRRLKWANTYFTDADDSKELVASLEKVIQKIEGTLTVSYNHIKVNKDDANCILDLHTGKVHVFTYKANLDNRQNILIHERFTINPQDAHSSLFHLTRGHLTQQDVTKPFVEGKKYGVMISKPLETLTTKLSNIHAEYPENEVKISNDVTKETPILFSRASSNEKTSSQGITQEQNIVSVEQKDNLKKDNQKPNNGPGGIK